MKTVEHKRTRNKLTASADERLFVGVDVHKRSYHVAVWSTTRGLVADWRQAAHPEALLRRSEAVRSQVTRVAYEAGPTGFGLARKIAAVGLKVIVAAPAHLPRSNSRQPKTDRLDCIKLARLAAQGELRPACIPTEQEEADRQVGRAREQLARKLRRVKQQIKSLLLQYGEEEPAGLKNWTKAGLHALREMKLGVELRFCLDGLVEELEFLSGQMRKALKQLEQVAQSDRHREAMARLRTAPGVGPLTAATFRLELIRPDRFVKPSQIARYTGLAPGVSQSGQTHHGGPILKAGNGRIRTALVEASWRAIRNDPALRKRFMRLVHNTGSLKKAIVAIARLLSEDLWRLSIGQAPCRPKAA